MLGHRIYRSVDLRIASEKKITLRATIIFVYCFFMCTQGTEAQTRKMAGRHAFVGIVPIFINYLWWENKCHNGL
jgi:hypothetical protein